MKFIDYATLTVEAGKGGDGCLSFRREKFIERGGPDGGDGGDGGSVFFLGDTALNTLVDFRYKRQLKAESGRTGRGAKCTGGKGDDLYVPVPLGTSIYDQVTGELIGEVLQAEQAVLVAQGGFHGLGNTRYKSSINRAPRKTSNGSPGEKKLLRLELSVLADVGLLGMPNAGKSTLLRALSAARPKVADYPFTTLIPNLGIVRVDHYRSFVMADIPGLIEGAAEGVGLGNRFLNHLSRTRLLLHMVDIAPFDESNPADAFLNINLELKKYDKALAEKDQWLVLNKTDLILDQQEGLLQDLVEKMQWHGPVFPISAVSGQGTDELCQKVMVYLEEIVLP